MSLQAVSFTLPNSTNERVTKTLKVVSNRLPILSSKMSQNHNGQILTRFDMICHSSSFAEGVHMSNRLVRGL